MRLLQEMYLHATTRARRRGVSVGYVTKSCGISLLLYARNVRARDRRKARSRNGREGRLLFSWSGHRSVSAYAHTWSGSRSGHSFTPGGAAAARRPITRTSASFSLRRSTTRWYFASGQRESNRSSSISHLYFGS